MADIIEFRPADSKRHDDGLTAGERGPAEVVVFPGVRYERRADAADAMGETGEPAGMHRRDVIELAE